VKTNWWVEITDTFWMSSRGSWIVCGLLHPDDHETTHGEPAELEIAGKWHRVSIYENLAPPMFDDNGRRIRPLEAISESLPPRDPNGPGPTSLRSQPDGGATTRPSGRRT
jgi:hypothetical protein